MEVEWLDSHMNQLTHEMHSEISQDEQVLRQIHSLCIRSQFPQAIKYIQQLYFESHRYEALEQILYRLASEGSVKCIAQMISVLHHLVCLPTITSLQLIRHMQLICRICDKIESSQEFRRVWYRDIWPTARRLATLFKQLQTVQSVEQFQRLNETEKSPFLKQLIECRKHRFLPVILKTCH